MKNVGRKPLKEGEKTAYIGCKAPTSLDDFLKGCVDGLIFMENVHYSNMFPPNKMTEEERIKISKKANFHRINMPTEGIATGQFILMYNKFAKEHPKELSGTARSCVWKSMVNAYGWK